MESDRPLRVTVVGACHLDRKARGVAPFVAGASNPAELQSCPGGVARNVAENLCRLGAEVELVTRLGADAEGDALLAGLRTSPLGLAGVSRSPAAPTAFHLIALQPDGEMLVAVADMRVYDEITPALIRNLPESVWESEALIADCNLPQETLAFLAGLRQKGRRMAAIGVSPAKAGRLRPHLAACDFLLVNRREAAVLTGLDPERAAPAALAEALLAAGAGEVVLTLGAAGICLAGAGAVVELPTLPGRLVDVTGAGDALAAAFLAARLQGRDLESAGRRALAAARLTVETTDSVSAELTPERLEQISA
ncbi:PfkB family carbohydrate kinase [Pelagibius marinus]|uniref:PfkB family carbohydrate kinase n=1 Tax=Pelagibius marinus TaxID=2762760 RepID=UPI001872AC96|nr:PfkB family carbohydrate kinase [Pelagibius marinus]